MSWLACELHCHTVHSDGAFEPRELQKNARDNALSLIALTDHNTKSGCAELDQSIIPVISGIEWTTYFGHMLVLGGGFTDWRDAVPDNIDKKIAQAKATGAVVGIAHPFQTGAPVCTGGRWEFNVNDYSAVDYIEIWHDRFFHGSYENERSLAFWTELLDRGYHIAATYGRDWHSNEKEGHFGCTYLNFEKEISPEAALDALKNGRTVVSSGAKFFCRIRQNGCDYNIGDTLQEGKAELQVFTDDYARSHFAGETRLVHREIRLVTNGGECVKKCRLTDSACTVQLIKNSWYRAELWGELAGRQTLLAVTSPFYTQ